LTGALVLPERILDEQRFGDLRNPPEDLLNGVDAVVHLAAISNDPMGNKFEAVTKSINADASARFARAALESGVTRFVFASSCSIYGYTEGGARKESDSLNPLTAYARSKVYTEKVLAELNHQTCVVTSLRFSTACGMSDRLRLDLVLNDFVASAIAMNKIVVLSDGSPWRPLIDVTDMARAVEWALVRDAQAGGYFLTVNVGRDDWNFQVFDLAQAVVMVMPDTSVMINSAALPDRRSYRVDFTLYGSLAPNHQPLKSIDETIRGLIAGLRRLDFNNAEFRSSEFMRLRTLECHIREGRLDSSLRWVL